MSGRAFHDLAVALSALAVAAAVLAAAPSVARAGGTPDCGAAALTIYSGDELLLTLPDQNGSRLELGSGDVLRIEAAGVAPAGAVTFTVDVPFSNYLKTVSR